MRKHVEYFFLGSPTRLVLSPVAEGEYILADGRNAFICVAQTRRAEPNLASSRSQRPGGNEPTFLEIYLYTSPNTSLIFTKPKMPL